MANLSGQDMVDEVRQNLGDRTDLDDTRLLRLVNLTLDRLVRVADFFELQEITLGTASVAPRLETGTQTYSLPTILSTTAGSIRLIYEIRRVDTGQRIDEAPIRRQDEAVPQADYNWGTTKQRRYLRYGDNILVTPTPTEDVGLAVRWAKYHTDLTLATTSDIKELDDVLIAGTTAWVALSKGNTALYDKWIGIYTDLLQSNLDLAPEAVNTAQMEIIRTQGNG